MVAEVAADGPAEAGAGLRAAGEAVAFPAAADHPAAAAHRGAGEIMKLMNEADHKSIAEAIRDAESRTSGEIYAVLARRSDSYFFVAGFTVACGILLGCGDRRGDGALVLVHCAAAGLRPCDSRCILDGRAGVVAVARALRCGLFQSASSTSGRISMPSSSSWHAMFTSPPSAPASCCSFRWPNNMQRSLRMPASMPRSVRMNGTISLRS